MTSPTLMRHMGTGSAVLLVIGSVIGSGIFMKPLAISQALPSVGWIYGGWALLGVVCLFGAFAYAELGAMFPRAGGQYTFLREAWGPFVAFLYGWCLLTAINTGTLAALAVAFADNLAKVVSISESGQVMVGMGMIVVLAAVNHCGVRWGTRLQNVSTVAKLAALAAIVGVAFLGRGEPGASPAVTEPYNPPDLLAGLVTAAVALFWAYEGWHQLAFSAAEMKDPKRSLPRGLLIGLAVLIVTYVAVNAAYLHLVPLDEMRLLQDDADVPETAIVRILGGTGGVVLALLICLSVFGAANPNMLSTPRAFMEMAKDGAVPPILMRVHPKWRTPYVAIWIQAVWAILLILYLKRFSDITDFVVFAALIFYGLVVLGVYVLRFRRPDHERPHRCWGYPLTPAIFVAVVVFVDVHQLFDPGHQKNALTGLAILVVGALVYPFTARWRRSPVA